MLGADFAPVRFQTEVLKSASRQREGDFVQNPSGLFARLLSTAPCAPMETTHSPTLGSDNRIQLESVHSLSECDRYRPAPIRRRFEACRRNAVAINPAAGDASPRLHRPPGIGQSVSNPGRLLWSRGDGGYPVPSRALVQPARLVNGWAVDGLACEPRLVGRNIRVRASVLSFKEFLYLDLQIAHRIGS